MKCKLIVQINKVVIRDYSLLEDEGFCSLVEGSAQMGNPGITLKYEDDEENLGCHMIVIAAPDLPSILKFLDFAEIEVQILT